MIKPVSVANAYNHMIKYCLKGTDVKTFPNGTKVSYEMFRDLPFIYKHVERKNGTAISSVWQYATDKNGLKSLEKFTTYESNFLGTITHSVKNNVKHIAVETGVFFESRCFKAETPVQNLTKNADLTALTPKEQSKIAKIKKAIDFIRNNVR